MELIQKWLDGNRSFIVGRILYNQYGADEAFKRWLAQGETPDAKKQLELAMQAIVMPAKKEIAKNSDVSFSKMPAGDDPVCNAIQEDWKQHYTLMNMLRGKLGGYEDDNSPEAIAECNVLCQKILEEERYINACWEKLRYYQQHGKLPEEKEESFEIPGDPVALAKLIETLKRNVRRNKQKAAAAPANPLYPALVKKYEEQLKQINDAKN